MSKVLNVVMAIIILVLGVVLYNTWQQKELYKLYKTEIVDTINQELYIIDGGTLEQGQFYRIHFNYKLDTKDKNNNWWELYIDDDFSY